MTSQYPGAIDGYQNIRIVRDSIDEVLAKDHNDNRSAVVAIEQSLGIRPQGTYGTVVARLDQADTDFATHINGIDFRHVADHIDYPGSSPSSFADGYMLSPAKLGRTVSEIVARIGASTPAGASGADKIGITPYTDPYFKYSHPSAQVRGQILGIQNDLAENATLLERTLGAFVVDGMGVTDPYGTGNIARVAAGHIVSDGRLLRFNGGDLAVPSAGSPTIYYVYAVINNGSVSIGIDDATLPSMDPLNPAVLLRKIVRDSGIWDSNLSTDIRRYGMLVNSKNFFSVGKTPSGGKDGYGCDFLSLKAAVDYVRALTPSSKLIASLRIELATDIIITSDSELEILIETDGLVIDGCGKRVIATTGVSHALFSIQANNVKIENLTLVSNCSSPFLRFADLGTTSSVDNLHINNCGIDAYPGQASGDMFLLFGETTGALTVFNAFITDNMANVVNGGIVCAAVNPYTQVLQDAKITGNIIQQQTLAAVASPGIQASVNCVVSDNLVIGGFVSGICLNAPVNTRVSNNVVLGTDYSTVAMPTGIAIWVPGPSGNGYGALVTQNIIRGVNNFGIDNNAGAQAGQLTLIANNTIDNSNISTWSYGAFGINVYSYEVPVLDNKIIWMGYPIYQANYVVGNDIYGHGIAAGDGILCVPSSSKILICNNRIYNLVIDYNLYPTGSAININGTDQAVVSGNEIQNCSVSGGVYLNAGITMGRGTEATVLGNVISYPTIGTNNMFGVSDIGDNSIVYGNIVTNQQYGAFFVSSANHVSFIGNKVYNCGATGIEMTDTAGSMVVDNLLVIDDPTLNPGSGINGFSSNCVVASNIVVGYAAGSYGIAGNFGSFRSTVVANNMVLGLHADTQGAIIMAGGWRDISVVNNIICNTKGFGIDMTGSARSIVSGNLLLGTPTGSGSGIDKVGQYSVVANNAILEYGNGTTGFGISLLDAYSSVVIGNTIAAGPDMTKGIYLDANVGSVDNLIADNILNGLVYVGIDLVSPAVAGYGGSFRHTVANNIVIGTSQNNNAPGIENAASQSVVVGNHIVYPNGEGIHVVGNGALVGNNSVMEPQGHGIYFYGGTGVTILSGLVVGNIVSQSTENGSGIIVGNSWAISITGNYAYGFITGISLWQFDGGSSIDCSVCGNYILQDPVAPVGYAGIYADTTCTSLSIVGNFIFGSQIGIELFSGAVLISSNQIVWHRTVGIEAHGMDELCIVSNLVGPPYPLTLTADGIDLTGCIKTLVVGNLAYAQNILGFGFGTSFVIDSSQPSDGLVMTGNLGRAGAAAPSDGAGGNWSSDWVIDDCRWIF